MTLHKVMVVEDDDDIREALSEILEEHGCEVSRAANGQKALDYLVTASKLPCLILLDLMMPVMDGTAFREQQLKDSRLAQIPVVVMSAYRDLDSVASKLGAVKTLKKPPKIEELVAAVQHHC